MELNVIPKPNKVKLDLTCRVSYDKNKYQKRIINDKTLKEEGYRIKADFDGILLEAQTERGLFYGDITIKQIINQFDKDIPYFNIVDVPQYEYRSFMLDCCRHFFTVDEIKKQIKILSMFKINKFHWHLSDDQGWRLEIAKYPRLTEIGSIRKQTRGDNKVVKGFYTKEDVKEIIDYCNQYYIDVIPEIDIPGHFTAGVASYNELGCKNEKIEVSEGFGILPNILCLGSDFSNQFCRDVLDEMIELFPSKYIHIGGDETLMINWLTCPKCQDKMNKNGFSNPRDLQIVFLNEIADYLRTKGKIAICWNDGLGKNQDIVCQYWKENKELLSNLLVNLNNNGRAIISPFSKYYMDYNYGITSLKKTYNFSYKDLGIKDNKNILGIEGPLWTEYIKDIKKVEMMTYPRILAIAETGWTDTANKNYNDFKKRCSSILKYLKENDYSYTSLKDVDPNIFKAFGKKVKFAFNVINKDNIKSFKLIQKYKRLIKK